MILVYFINIFLFPFLKLFEYKLEYYILLINNFLGMFSATLKKIKRTSSVNYYLVV